MMLLCFTLKATQIAKSMCPGCDLLCGDLIEYWLYFFVWRSFESSVSFVIVLFFINKQVRVSVSLKLIFLILYQKYHNISDKLYQYQEISKVPYQYYISIRKFQNESISIISVSEKKYHAQAYCGGRIAEALGCLCPSSCADRKKKGDFAW